MFIFFLPLPCNLTLSHVLVLFFFPFFMCYTVPFFLTTPHKLSQVLCSASSGFPSCKKIWGVYCNTVRVNTFFDQQIKHTNIKYITFCSNRITSPVPCCFVWPTWCDTEKCKLYFRKKDKNTIGKLFMEICPLYHSVSVLLQESSSGGCTEKED